MNVNSLDRSESLLQTGALDKNSRQLHGESVGKNGARFKEALQAAENAADTSLVQAASAKKKGMATSMDEIFEEASALTGVDVRLLKAVGKAESSFDPSATSRSGAMGVMQLMPATARELGVSNAYDARENILGGARYLAGLLQRYNGRKELALAAYNAGSNNVEKYGGIPPFEETQNYVRRVLSYLGENLTTGRMVSPGASYGTYGMGNSSFPSGTTARNMYDGFGMLASLSSSDSAGTMLANMMSSGFFNLFGDYGYEGMFRIMMEMMQMEANRKLQKALSFEEDTTSGLL